MRSLPQTEKLKSNGRRSSLAVLFLADRKFKYLGSDISTPLMTIPPYKALNYHILNLHNNTHPISKSITRHPINQYHLTHHPDYTTLHIVYTQSPFLMRGLSLRPNF